MPSGQDHLYICNHLDLRDKSSLEKANLLNKSDYIIDIFCSMIYIYVRMDYNVVSLIFGMF